MNGKFCRWNLKSLEVHQLRDLLYAERASWTLHVQWSLAALQHTEAAGFYKSLMLASTAVDSCQRAGELRPDDHASNNFEGGKGDGARPEYPQPGSQHTSAWQTVKPSVGLRRRSPKSALDASHAKSYTGRTWWSDDMEDPECSLDDVENYIDEPPETADSCC